MDINGTYLGIGPSIASRVESGEAELVISDETVTMRLATGVNVVTVFDVPRSALVELSTSEIASHYRPGADINGIIAWRIGETGHIMLLLADLPGSEEDARMIVLGLPEEDVFDPASLFTPAQVAAGCHTRALTMFDAAVAPFSVPRLVRNGR